MATNRIVGVAVERIVCYQTGSAGISRRNLETSIQPLIGYDLHISLVNNAVAAQVGSRLTHRRNTSAGIYPDIIDVYRARAAKLRTAPVAQANIHLLDSLQIYARSAELGQLDVPLLPAGCLNCLRIRIVHHLDVAGIIFQRYVELFSSVGKSAIEV